MIKRCSEFVRIMCREEFLLLVLIKVMSNAKDGLAEESFPDWDVILTLLFHFQ